ncbi:MAG: MSMEG_4193 family putative phosphomutase [Chloroflexi bacterium]|nr:MSMEG_4193 family putative phosphomutase [Chloroflexota bacterium]
MSTTLLLVRHGENDWVKENKLAGRLPGIHLNDTGRMQARRLAARLADWPLTSIYSSPLERCLETATIIARPHHLPIQTHTGILETDYGEWQGQPYETLMKRSLWPIIVNTPSQVVFPGGEGFLTMQYRVVSTLQEIARAHEEELVLVCTHADPIKAALAYYAGVHLDHFQRFVIEPASLSLVQLSQSGPLIVSVNDTGTFHPPLG